MTHEPEPSLSVLIVIGDPERCRQWSQFFAAVGHRVVAVTEGAEALAKLRSATFDVAIVSVLMEGLDGLELLRLLPQTAPGLPVIVIGSPESRFNETYLRCAELLGAAETHRHPPNPEKVIESVRRVVREFGTKAKRCAGM